MRVREGAKMEERRRKVRRLGRKEGQGVSEFKPSRVYGACSGYDYIVRCSLKKKRRGKKKAVAQWLEHWLLSQSP